MGHGSSGKGRDGARILPALPLQGLPGHPPHRKAIRQEEGHFLFKFLGSWRSRPSSAVRDSWPQEAEPSRSHPDGGGSSSNRQVWLFIGIMAPGLETHESQKMRADQGARYSLNLLTYWHQSWQQRTETGRRLTIGQEHQPVQKLHFGVN